MADKDPDIRVIDRRWWARNEAGTGADEAQPLDKPSYVQELEQRLAAKDEELRSTIAKYRDASNEFEQARLRMRRDLAKDLERTKRSMLADLLDVMDNLDRAIAAGERSGADAALLQGVTLVRTHFLTKLDGLGVRRIESLGERFDPNVHEAAAVVPAADRSQDGLVVGVIRPGYAIGEDVLRPAVVAVARLGAEAM